MDPTTIAQLMGGASGLMKSLQPVTAPPPPQRADGYALGGTADGANNGAATGGATGGAYGGAWSQANVDGSNWVVSTGTSQAYGSGTSGGNGGLSPVQSNFGQGGVSPQSPFSFGAPGVAQASMSSGTAMLLGLAVLAFLMVKK